MIIFAGMALADYRRNGRRATRWREYCFLVSAVLVALVYGVCNDQVTSRISWEYFYYFKGLSESLGPKIPPDSTALSLGAMVVAVKATWTVGLLIGVAFLLANNPSNVRLQLPYGSLFRTLSIVLLSSISFAAAMGIAGWSGRLTFLSEDFQEMVRRDEFRPHHFMAVYGIHLGGYIGGAVGTAIAVISIRRNRKLK